MATKKTPRKGTTKADRAEKQSKNESLTRQVARQICQFANGTCVCAQRAGVCESIRGTAERVIQLVRMTK